jgi:hypothetical protein
VDKLGLALAMRAAGDGTFIDDWANFRSTLRIEPDGFLNLDVGGDDGRFEPLQPYAPTAGDIASVIGLYHCADMRSDAEVFVRGDTLILRFGLSFRREAEVRLEPLAKDMFFARYERPWAKHAFAVRFVRNTSGVARMLVNSTLLKNTAFARV